ncbi:GerAB/ArcD/ProY family transporter [Niallia taxi]|uniref:GerAB/ArcD/ProY family transporter n=1 Tax=Niallia taxi TaxID=2499688 RepID=UPI0015F41393|nr:GerAB/ArcD/ProY family transporter [Niallia taxi]
MDKYREHLTPIQVACIMISGLVGISILAVPREIAGGTGLGGAGSATPLASLLGSSVTFIGLLALLYLGKRFPKQTVISYANTVIGKPLGRVYSFLVIVFFIGLAGLEIRQFGEVIVGALLPRTPIQIPIFFMALLCAVTGFQRVATFAYLHFFYLPLILIPMVIIVFPAFQDLEIYHLTPVLGNSPTLIGFLSGSLIMPQALTSFFVVAMLIPFMKDPKKCVKGGTWGFWIGTIIIMVVTTICIGVFGEKEIRQMFWPTLNLGRMVHVPAEIFARIDSVLVISWIYATFTTILTYYFIAIRGTGELFHFHKYKVMSALSFFITFFVAMWPDDIYEVYNFILSWTLFGILVTIVIPLFLLFIAIIRKKRGEGA